MMIGDKVLAMNYPPSPEGDLLAAEVKNWGDEHPFLGGVKGSTTLVDPGTFTLIVRSNYSIEQCFAREQDRAAMRWRFWEMTEENRERLLG